VRLTNPAVRQPPRRSADSVKLLDGPITAACLASGTGRLFLGRARGEVACLDPLAVRVFQIRSRAGYGSTQRVSSFGAEASS
jgi:hypothetical protein